MSIKNFLNAGGIVEIRLQKDLLRFGYKNIFFAANSLDSARIMALRLYEVELDLKDILKREDIHIDLFVDSIVFCWNRTHYELENPHPPLIKLFRLQESRNEQEPGRYKPYYLIAANKCP